MTLNKHLLITNHGSILSVKPLTTYAENWFKENVQQDGMRNAGAYVIESRFWNDIKNGFEEDVYFDQK